MRVGNVSVHDQMLRRNNEYRDAEPLHIVLGLAHDINCLKRVDIDTKIGIEQQWGQAVKVFKYIVLQMTVNLMSEKDRTGAGVGVAETIEEASLSVSAQSSCFKPQIVVYRRLTL